MKQNLCQQVGAGQMLLFNIHYPHLNLRSILSKQIEAPPCSVRNKDLNTERVEII